MTAMGESVSQRRAHLPGRAGAGGAGGAAAGGERRAGSAGRLRPTAAPAGTASPSRYRAGHSGAGAGAGAGAGPPGGHSGEGRAGEQEGACAACRLWDLQAGRNGVTALEYWGIESSYKLGSTVLRTVSAWYCCMEMAFYLKFRYSLWVNS